MIKIGIIGSRSINDFTLIENKVNIIIKNKDLEYNNIIIVSGGAKGVDSLAEMFAKKFNIATEIYIPDWKKYGRSAGMIRNGDIVKNSDIVIVFWDGVSKGSLYTIEKCKKNKKEYFLFKV